MKLIKYTFTICFYLIVAVTFAQRGIDGNRTISAAGTIVNEYTSLTADAAAGATTISVAASGLNANTRFGAGNTLAAGDLIMIIQMQGPSSSTTFGLEFPAGSGQLYGFQNDNTWGQVTSYNNCGNYELCQVNAVPSGTSITVDCGLKNAYTAAGRVQVIRVPRYNTLTITGAGVLTAQAWVATAGVYTGGVVAVEVYGATTITGSINATALGFRGGSKVGDNNSGLGGGQVSRNDNNEGSEKGEGIFGYQADYDIIGGRYCRGAAGNAGGGGDAHNSGGGGGANAGTGVWDGEGNPDVSGGAGWIAAWNLEAIPTFATHVSSGGGRGGYSFSSANRNATLEGPKAFQAAGSNLWGGDFRINNGGWGGRPLDYSTGKLFLGGGGGAGDQDNGCAGNGGIGGGLIYVLSYGAIGGTGTVVANGQAGGNTTTSGFSIGIDGAGGGGGGGTIILNAIGTVSGISATANGGNGGNQSVTGSEAEGPGGSGGGGYIAVSTGAITMNAAAGANGTTNSTALTEFTPNGATRGAAGLTNQAISTDTINAANVTICSGNTATLNATIIGSIPGTITWYSAVTGGTALGTGSPFTTPVLSATTTYYVGICPGTYRIPVVVTVNTSPTASNAGSNQSLCATSATFAGNTPTAGTGTWTLVSGSGTITSPSSPTSTVTGLGAGANVFQWTISNPPCGTSSTQVTITNTGGPTTSAAGSNQTVCGTTATLAGNVPTTGTGTWTLVSGAGTITSPSSASSGVTGLGVGANIFQWTISNPPCTASSSQVTITGVASPTTSNAGSNQTLCATSATLAGNTPTAGTGTWTLVSGAGTITTPSSPTSTVTGLGAGANVFQWTITNAPCTASSSQVTITNTGGPTTSAAGSNQTVCGTTATLAGNVPTTGTGTWTLVSGAGTITSPSSATSGVTGLGVGANVFQWTISNPPCTASSSQVTITGVAAPSTSAAGSNQTVCGTTATLAGNTPTTGTGTWTLVSGAGTITTPSSAASGITGLGVGANVFQWTIANSPCAPSSSQVTITGVAAPTASNAGTNQTLCSTSATLTGNTPTSGTGLWTLVSGAGTITTPSSPSTTVTGLAAGANVFQWTISNAPCTSSSTQVTITNTGGPTTSAAGSNQTVCGTTATLAGNVPTTGTGTWTLVSGAGTITTPSSASSGVTGLGVGANVFQWTISNPPCTASSSQVTITGVASPSTSAAGSNQTVCGTTATLAGNTPTTGTGTWTLVSGAGTITSPSLASSGITGLGVGANVFQWTIDNAPCTPSSSQVTITVVAAPTTSNAGANQSICSTSASLAGNIPTTGTGTWTLISGAGTITTPSSATSAVTGLGIGANVFQWTIDNAPCTASSSQVTITVTTAANATINNLPSVCIGETAFDMTAATAGGTWSGTGITSATNGTFDPATGTGTYIITYTISGTCGSSDTSVVTVTPNADASITPPPALCASASSITLAAATSGGTWSGAGITNTSTGTYDPSVAGIGTDTVIYSIPGTCGSSDTIVVTVNATSDASITSVPPICAGSPSFNMTAVTAGGTWSGTGITSGTAGTFNPATVGTYTVTYTISGACAATDSTVVTVIPAISASITSVSPVCANASSFGLTASVTGGTWAGAGITDAVNGTFNPSLALAGSNTITYSIGGACGDTASQTIIVYATPTPAFSSNITSGCSPVCITLSEAASNNCTTILYDFGDGSTSATNTHCYSASGVYSVSISCTDTNNCTGTTVVSNMITVNPSPTADFTVSPSGIVPPNTIITFTDVSTGGGNQAWNFDDPASGSSNTSNLFSDTHTYSTEDIYCVTLIASNSAGCADTAKQCITVADEATLFVPNVFTPNADGDNDIFYITSSSVKELQCSIYDRWGLKIADWIANDDAATGWNGRTTSGLPASDGVYFYILKATALNGKEIQKEGFLQLLKEK
jgi:gliding motility-associated-like protein